VGRLGGGGKEWEFPDNKKKKGEQVVGFGEKKKASTKTSKFFDQKKIKGRSNRVPEFWENQKKKKKNLRGATLQLSQRN